MTINVLRPGLLTTVQDAGRFGRQSLGIGPGGAMDLVALRVANTLVGNGPGAAAIECTLVGPVLHFEHDTLFAVNGGSWAATIAGERLPHGRAVFGRAGTELVMGSCTAGCRGMLAVAGGIDVPEVLDSWSTNLRAHFGGFDGRALRAADQLTTGAPSPEATHLMHRLAQSGRRWAADGAGFSREITTNPAPGAPIRMIPGAALDQLTDASRAAFIGEPYRVGARSDRMGYRLEGPVLILSERKEMTSEGVAWGTVQLPPDGQPIILLADRQTTGGYPVIGHVATVDRGPLANARPGDEIRFEFTTVAEAQAALRDREQMFAAALQALRTQRTVAAG